MIMESNEDHGFCICVHCNIKIPHKKGQPCRAMFCNTCGKKLMREGNYHHLLYLKKTGENNENSSTN